MRRRRARAMGVALAALVGAVAHADKPVFKHPLDGAPIQTPLKPGESETPALKQFKDTGVNDYRGNAAAVAEGKALYNRWCQVCHGADGTGNMGPSLVGSQHVYAQTATDPGMFAIIYAGASGAMQPFGNRDLTQDDMLK